MRTSGARNSKPKSALRFEHEERFQHLSRRQDEIEEKLDLTKNQAPSQVEADSPDETARRNSETQDVAKTIRQKRHAGMTV